MADNKHGYKAYEPGLVCRGHQYEEGKIYKKNGHGVCVGGVTHYCWLPTTVFVERYRLWQNVFLNSLVSMIWSLMQNKKK